MTEAGASLANWPRKAHIITIGKRAARLRLISARRRVWLGPPESRLVNSRPRDARKTKMQIEPAFLEIEPLRRLARAIGCSVPRLRKTLSARAVCYSVKNVIVCVLFIF